jgi:cell division protein FtsQ
MRTESEFSRRLHAERRRRRSRRAVRTAAGVAPVVLAALLLSSPVLDVDRVVVRGNRQLSAARVAELSGIRTGTQLVRVDAEAAARRLEGDPVVAEARVRRDWPGAVRVEVVERQPAIGVVAGGTLSVYAADGVAIASGGRLPEGTPLLTVPSAPAPAELVTAAVTVVRAMDDALRRQVATLAASSPRDITLTTRGGAVVVWGGAEASERKARVLAQLLPRGGRRFDLRSPDHPAVTP